MDEEIRVTESLRCEDGIFAWTKAERAEIGSPEIELAFGRIELAYVLHGLSRPLRVFPDLPALSQLAQFLSHSSLQTLIRNL